MRHFVAYHNTERMGRPLHEGEPLKLLTNKPVEALRGNTVWFVVGEEESPKRYALGSVFVVDDVGDNPIGEEFKHFASGTAGHVFRTPPALNDRPWFPELMRSMANFSLGVQEVKDPRLIEAIIGLASESGY